MTVQVFRLNVLTAALPSLLLCVTGFSFGDCSNITPCDKGTDNKCSLGDTSKGRFEICMQVQRAYRVWGLKNIDLGTAVPGSKIPGPTTMNFCVYSNQDNGEFNVELSGSQLRSNEDLAVRDTKSSVKYTLDLATTGGSSYSYKKYGDKSDFLPGTTSFPDPDIPDCSGSNITATVTLDADSFKDASEGNYSDALVLTVSPSSAGG